MKQKYIIGIDLGGTNLKLALLDRRCTIKDKYVLSTKEYRKKDELINALIAAVERMLTVHHVARTGISGIGIGLPGPIDTVRGLVHFFPNIQGWHEVKLRQLLEKRLKVPVRIDNDANVMALAEYTLGAAKGARNAVCITLGTGVGGGLIIEGKLYRGSSFAAGEIGHVPINECGPRCNCGGSGCLEAYIGNAKIIQEAQRIFKGPITLEALSKLAKKRNRKAMDIWYNVATHLGIALSGIVNVLNPDVIVIGGGIAGAGKILFERTLRVIRQRAMHVQAGRIKLVSAKLGSDAGLIGAAVLARDTQ